MNLRFVFLFGLLASASSLHSATEIVSNGVTWKFTSDRPSGVFLTGDPWVVGPVAIISISNSLNDRSFTPRAGQNGSMINPAGNATQGYDDAVAGYEAALNVGLTVSKATPLILPPHTSLVSSVSWLYRTPTEREPGAPRFDGGQRAPRPALRSVGILTVLDKAPPADAFRPPYSGTDKTVRFTRANLDYSKLPGLAPVPNMPSWEGLAKSMARPWLDHYTGWVGGHLHPSEHMPNYGRDLARIVGHCAMAVLIGNEKPGENPAKDRTIANLVQFGIDLTGIAATGGHWPPDGGHGMGRKFPILFAGALLKDPHMLNVGHWNTAFQEDRQTFYVSQAEVDLTNSPRWAPDKRAELIPYTTADIGTAEWGIRHAVRPQANNAAWTATYRDINGSIVPAFALAARLMGLKDAWNHPAFFDYSDRFIEWQKTAPRRPNQTSAFLDTMWQTYRAKAE
jgi:hypothetical protein